MGRIRPFAASASAALLLAVGTAMAAAFGPEYLKSVVPSDRQRWWFVSLFGLAIVLLLVGAWQRKKASDLDTIAIVAAANDPATAAMGRAILSSAQSYARKRFPLSMAPFVYELPMGRAEAAALVDALGDQLNEMISFTDTLAPSAKQIHLVLAMRNAAAFRLGLKVGRNHRKEIVLHHGDNSGHYPAIRLACAQPSTLAGLSDAKVELRTGDPRRAALLLNLSDGRHKATFERAEAACGRAGYGLIIDVRYDSGRIPAKLAAFETIVLHALAAWNRHRPAGLRGPSIVLLDCPAVIAAALGAHLATHPDGPWIPYEYDNQAGTYDEFAPNPPATR
jgi:hypothetical protein